jgi:hypothetical protein
MHLHQAQGGCCLVIVGPGRVLYLDSFGSFVRQSLVGESRGSPLVCICVVIVGEQLCVEVLHSLGCLAVDNKVMVPLSSPFGSSAHLLRMYSSTIWFSLSSSWPSSSLSSSGFLKVRHRFTSKEPDIETGYLQKRCVLC